MATKISRKRRTLIVTVTMTVTLYVVDIRHQFQMFLNSNLETLPMNSRNHRI